MDRRVVQEVVHTLTYLHADGSTATPAVTPIDAAAQASAGAPAGSNGTDGAHAGGPAGGGTVRRVRFRRPDRFTQVDEPTERSGTEPRPLG
jgi:hypothetical protein